MAGHGGVPERPEVGVPPQGQLGARRYLDSQADDVAAELAARGGARVILATVTSAKAMTAVIDGLAVDPKLLVFGAAAEPIEVSPFQLIGESRTRCGAAISGA